MLRSVTAQNVDEVAISASAGRQGGAAVETKQFIVGLYDNIIPVVITGCY